jgi:hypothetical protein
MLHTADAVRTARESSGAACPEINLLSTLFAIPISLVDAFRDAVEAVDDLHRGGPEAVLQYKGAPVSIRYVIEVASIFHERMPDDVYERLRKFAGFGEEPSDHTFAAGAQCLRFAYTDLRARRRGAVAAAQTPLNHAAPARQWQSLEPLASIGATLRLAFGRSQVVLRLSRSASAP